MLQEADPRLVAHDQHEQERSLLVGHSRQDLGAKPMLPILIQAEHILDVGELAL